MSDGQDPLLREAEQHRLKEQVFWRLGIAAGLIVIILAGIYLLDRPAPETPQVAVTPAKPRIAVVATPTPAIASVPAAASLPAEASAPTSSAPARTTPTVEPPAPPAATPAPTQAAAMTAAPTPIPAPRETMPSRLAGATPTPAAARPAPIIRPTAPTLARPGAPTSPAVAAPPTPQALRTAQDEPAAYTVQAGVFLHADNAEKLLRQLQKAGIPAYLETRVQIGPFKTKAEAEAAKRQLRALGIEPVLRNN
ncbi:SPOR domain-containing protein [Chitiniphilus shinanonensis]|uniref:SPOR domain-containing protein n=1 Tax=Chitiniphilus shinanonensis TaxID=553088 RepID=UPI00304E8535